MSIDIRMPSFSVLQLFLLLLLLVASVFYGVWSGSLNIAFFEVWSALFGSGDPHMYRVIVELRLPRVVTGGLIGVHLALAGWILQALTRNPLADPGVLGISGGASLGAVLSIVFGTAAFFSRAYGFLMFDFEGLVLPISALIGAAVSAVIVCFFGFYYRYGSMTRAILFGAVFAGVLQALTAGVLASWGHAQTESAVQWLAGSLYGVSWADVKVLLPWTAISLICLFVLLPRLAVLRLSDDQAALLGLSFRRWQIVAMGLSTMLAASATAVVGPVGFVGLLVPHLSRRIVGGRFSTQAVFCAVLGAILVVVSDTLGRSLLAPLEIPVGVTSAVLGVPFFLYVLARRN